MKRRAFLPAAAAWVASLAPDPDILKERAAAVELVIAHYDYSQLYYSRLFGEGVCVVAIAGRASQVEGGTGLAPS